METFTRLYPDRAEGLTAVDLAAELPGPEPDDRPFVCLNMRSGLIRTTSHARPVFSSAQMTHAEGSNCQRFRPWRADVGKA